MQKLYHGTLARNLPSIRVHGLLPQKGSWTATFYKDAPDLVYAVDEERKGRLLAIITGQLARAGLVNLSDTAAAPVFWTVA
jgi:RNA:NAD 2'-phosphotransferase (TPT1/KptA family)